MPISVSHIVEALSSLGGQAHLTEIVKRVVEIAPAPIPPSADAIVRGRLQNYSSDTRSFNKQADLFHCVYGVGARRGVWRLRTPSTDTAQLDEIIDGSEAFLEAAEGQAKLRIHLSRERSRTLIKKFKASLQNPRCEACGFSFNEKYGDLGNNYIEAHHKLPVASLVEGTKTKLTDLAALCANCHRVIHSNGLMSVEQLSAYLKNSTTE